MKVSVIVRCRNEEHYIGHTIQSIIDILGFESEIIIVDNNSTDRSKEIINLFTNNKTNNIIIKYLTISEYTPGKSINLALQECSNDIILILSAHSVIQEINEEKIITLLKEHKAVWGKQIPIYFGKKINRKRYIWANFEDKDNINYYSSGEDRYFLHNAFCFYNKKDLIEYPIDESYIGKEDRYWVKDMIEKEFKIYYDSEMICHHHFTNKGATWKSI
jgi:glycosyltransferase involved in cell wall biosynthesis